MSAKTGPVVYAKLLEIARQEPERLIHQRLTQSAQNNAEDISALLTTVYTQGLRDGFQQGVQAMSEPGSRRVAYTCTGCGATTGSDTAICDACWEPEVAA